MDEQRLMSGREKQCAETTEHAADKWAHRSEGMRCFSCMWFVQKATRNCPTVGNHIGRCRRHSPAMNGYPVVYSGDWCGDHKVDENK